MLEAGTVIGSFRILGLLGQGGMADVYEAEDTKLGRRVALKVLPEEFIRKQDLVIRFDKEVRAAAQLDHHGIVKVFDVGQDRGLHYFSMQLLRGGDLRKRIEQGMDAGEALSVLRQLAKAFEHAHGRGFVHRDVKPENVLFAEQGHAVLTDFGIAKAIGSHTRMTATGVSVGTPRYISPEQARGLAVDARSDLYSLGAILFEMLTGHPPYGGDDALVVIYKHVTEPVPRLPDHQQHLQGLVDTLLAKTPAERPSSARVLISIIDSLMPAAKAAAGSSRQAPVERAAAVPAQAPVVPPRHAVQAQPAALAARPPRQPGEADEPVLGPTPRLGLRAPHWQALTIPGLALLLAGTSWAYRDDIAQFSGRWAAAGDAPPAVAAARPDDRGQAPPAQDGDAPGVSESPSPPTALAASALPAPQQAQPRPQGEREPALAPGKTQPTRMQAPATAPQPGAAGQARAPVTARPQPQPAAPAPPVQAAEDPPAAPVETARAPLAAPAGDAPAERYQKAVQAGGTINADGTVTIRVRASGDDYDMRIDKQGRVVSSVPVIPRP